MRHFNKTGEQGIISSPGYPGYYYSNKNYYWRITVPEGKRIQVKFLDFGFPYSRSCPGDFLKVYDGRSSDDAVSEKYYAYGRRLPAAFNSSGRYLYLNFRSDEFTIGIGFKLEWKAFNQSATVDSQTRKTKGKPFVSCFNKECNEPCLSFESLCKSVGFKKVRTQIIWKNEKKLCCSVTLLRY